MTWNLAHRVLSAIVLYGASLIDMYQSLVNLLERDTGLILGGYWDPIIVLASIFFGGGVLAAIAGIYISKSIKLQEPFFWKFPKQVPQRPIVDQSKPRTLMALVRPLILVVAIVGVMLMISNIPVWIAAPVVFLLLVLASVHDRSIVSGVFRKPGFWIGLMVMVLLSGFLLGKNSTGIFNFEGLSIGVGMALRALAVIAGFKLLSRELRSPDLASWFRLRKLEGFLMAIQISFQTTPLLLESIPANHAWKNPVKVLKQLVSGMGEALAFMKIITLSNNIIILTGRKEKGKTTLSLKLATWLREVGFSVEGIVAPEIVENDERVGYMVQNVATGEKMPFARKTSIMTENQKVPFDFDKAALKFGANLLEQPQVEKADLVILDEAGPLELNGEGWAAAFTDVIAKRTKPTLLVIRPALLEAFKEKWNLGNPLVIDIEQYSPEEVLRQVVEKLKDTGVSF